MRRILFALLFAFVAFAATATAQTRTEETVTTIDSTGRETTVKVVKLGTEEDVTPRENMITINPLKFLLFYNLNYYRRISSAVVVGGGFQIPTIGGVGGFGFNAEMRWHPSGKAMRGFYLAPNFSFNSLSGDASTQSQTSTISITAMSLGVLAGWQWFPGDDFAIGLGIGADHYFSTDATDGETTWASSFDGVAPALRFDIGYAW